VNQESVVNPTLNQRIGGEARKRRVKGNGKTRREGKEAARFTSVPTTVTNRGKRERQFTFA